MDKFLKRKADQKSEDSDDKDKCEKKKKFCKYNPEYISYGSIAVGTNADQPLCVMCVQTLSNESMKPAKLNI